MSNIISVMTGSEEIINKKYNSQAWYTYHKNCPVAVESPPSFKLDMFIGPKGMKTAKRIEKKANIYVDEKNKYKTSQLKDYGWANIAYELPNNFIFKIKVTEAGYGFKSNLNSSVMFFRVRETAPYIEVSFKNNRLPFIVKGRLERLPYEFIDKYHLIRPTELNLISEKLFGEFLREKVLFPGIESTKQIVKETILVDDEEIEIKKSKSKIKLPTVY